MAVLIDMPRWPAHGRLWSHLVSDSSLDELHAFASSVGLPLRSFEGDHYDVPADHYDRLVAAGARPVTGRELVRALQASGLRLPKRKGERVLSSAVADVGHDEARPGGGTRRVDLLASPLEAPAAGTVWSGALVLGGERREPAMLLIPTDNGWALPGSALRDGETAAQCASRALAEQTGLQLAPTILRPCGHERDMPVPRAHRSLDGVERTPTGEHPDRTDVHGRSPAPEPTHGRRTTWRTVELAWWEPVPLIDPPDAAWLPARDAGRRLMDQSWAPLVEWVVTRSTT